MVHKFPIDKVIDLHTFAPSDIKSVVEEYIWSAVKARFFEIRVIHGRGLGVQRAIVHKVLKLHPAVKDYWDAPESHLGATIVVLDASEATTKVESRYLERE